MERKWFKNKTYGYGWQPASKEGWFITLIAVWIIASTAFNLEQDTTKSLTIIFSTIAVLIVICYKTGEKLKWQWGKK